MRTVDIATASLILKSGNVVAFPTETVYGLGADATNPQACAKIFELKQRPQENPLIIHVLDVVHATKFAIFTEVAHILTDKYWPGPLSLVLKSTRFASSVALAGQDTVCIRAPLHPVARSLIAACELGIAAPSANISSMISPTRGEHVAKYFDIPIIEDDSCTYGIESTIVDCTGQVPTILRDGFITQREIEDYLQIRCKRVTSAAAPGNLNKHYAPRCKIRTNVTYAAANEVAINFADSRLRSSFSMSFGANFVQAAQNFYATLHDAERVVFTHGLLGIACAPIPNIGIGMALNDKLKRASYEE